MKNSQGRTNRRRDYEREVGVNEEGNKVSQQTQAEGNGDWPEEHTCPSFIYVAVIKYSENKQLW